MRKGKFFKTLAIFCACLGAPLLLSGCGKEDDKFYITFMANGEIYKVYETSENQNIVNIPNPVKEGYTFEGWYSDENYENEIEDLSAYLLSNSKSNTTLYAKFSVNQYTIVFNTNSGSTISPITQDYNTAVSKPANPTRDGYEFGGWYIDNGTFENEYTFDTMPLNGITLYAKWNVETYTITYHLDDGTNGENPATYTILTNDIELEDASKEGYTFNGWYTEQSYTNKIETIYTNLVQNLNLYAKFTINQYTMTFNTNGGSTIAPITQDYNTAVSKPADPEKIYAEFDGWYTDNGTFANEYTFTTMPLNGITLYAKWKELFILEDTTITAITDYGKSFETIEIYEGITEIGNRVFVDCINLKSITIPASVLKIGDTPFSGCINLININVASDNNYFTSVDGILENKTQDTIIYYPEGKKDKILNLNSTINKIKSNAFYSCALEKVVISDITTWLKIEFENIYSNPLLNAQLYLGDDLITVVNIPDNIKEIKNHAFAGCKSIAEIQWNSTLESVGDYAFWGCEGLTVVDLNSLLSLTYIGNYSFYNCKNLKEAYIPINARFGTDSADCTYIFGGCNKLEKLSIPYVGSKDNAYRLGSIFEPRGTLGFLFDMQPYEGSVGIRPSYLTQIRYYIPETLETIIVTGDYLNEQAFIGCSMLKRVELLGKIEKINLKTFLDCTSLKTIILPKETTYIDYAAFANTSLTKIYYMGSKTDFDKIFVFEQESNQKFIDASKSYNYTN